MTDTDLIVPVELHALVANRAVRADKDRFKRWSPMFTMMLNEEFKTSGEPEPYENLQDYWTGTGFEGVHLQWQLPEALTTGHLDHDSGESTFPLVPNRWLVVRYATVRGATTVAGWVVHSDYLSSQRPDANPIWDGSNSYLNPYAATATTDRIGRAHDLATGPWHDPREDDPAPRPLFLTAIGSGLPAFAAFAPYHRNVFLFQDTLQDLRDRQHGDNYPPDAMLSYAVIGWYSDDDADILRQAPEIPDLLPPGADPGNLVDVLEALGWAVPDCASGAIRRTRYAGTALGVDWQREGLVPDSDRPDGTSTKFALGHSTADAGAALVAQQTRSARDGDLIKALFHGELGAMDSADGPIDLDEAMRRSWFSGSEGGSLWRVVNRPAEQDTDEPAPELPQPEWLDRLNDHQAEYDQGMAELARLQWRLWSLWWLRELPEKRRPKPFEFDVAAWNGEITAVGEQISALQATLEELQTAIDEFADRELPETQELKRSPQPSFYRPADPVIVMEGAGTTQPLGRPDDQPLPCRLPSALLTRVRIGGADVTPAPDPPAPDLTGLPELCRPLIAELAMLDRAARTGSALEDIVARPADLTDGPFPEYTRVWRQPWLPMYLQWRIKYCATPFRSGGTGQGGSDNWTFDGDDYHWNGTGVPEGDGEGGVRWTSFAGRSFLTPGLSYVLREQAKRKLAGAPDELLGQLRLLQDDFDELDILSQTLDGFNDWLIQQNGAAQVTTDQRILDLAGQSNHVPDAAGDRREQRFQPVRAGQFYFTELHVIDRFGQALRLVTALDSQPAQLAPVRAASVTPDPEKPLFPGAKTDRFIQLPPRLLQDARIRFEPVHHSDDRPLAAVSSAPDPLGDTPVAGWLLVNHLDQTLLVYAPDGSPLGELRVIRTAAGQREIAWNSLPHARYDEPGDFEGVYPHVAGFASELVGRDADTFGLLMTTIDRALSRIADPAPEEDRTPARLIGRPVAMIRARLGLELLGPPLTDPAWDEALRPSAQEYPDYRWPVRLGAYERLADGLIGYYTSEPGQDTSYRQLHVPVQGRDTAAYASAAADDGPYFSLIGTGAGIAMPARSVDRSLSRYLTLLACPHTAVHATTDLLPVTSLAVDADLTHRALAAIRASFRLNPLLAPVRSEEPTRGSARSEPEPANSGIFMPRPSALHGAWSWAEPLVSGDGPPLWTDLPILPADDLSHPDDPVPAARAGYLQLHPRADGQGETR
ncbi:hypothetical protein [Saccharothrix sp. ST-888]|uniref:hypothetical protein n=1 Tax=Saccharothrix sp. ST-888 TaxID=1427391 RepID=UPI0005EC2D50|nr:hypothetical protein [Saccharothrix sp. ST-888]KJK55491.1 hypothetical protein UK12_28265 [Saccharothrix sp. ST-888]